MGVIGGWWKGGKKGVLGGVMVGGCFFGGDGGE